jgi:hypothetical protein
VDRRGALHPQQSLLGFIQSRGVRRSLEIWDSQSPADIMRGLALKSGQRQLVSDIIAGLHARDVIARVQSAGAEQWQVLHPEKLPTGHYDPLLSVQAVASARHAARRYAAIARAEGASSAEDGQG